MAKFIVVLFVFRYARGYPKDAAPYYDAEPGYGRGRGGRGRGRGRSAGPGGPGGMIPPTYRKDYDLAPRDSYRYPAEGSGPIPYGHPQNSRYLTVHPRSTLSHSILPGYFVLSSSSVTCVFYYQCLKKQQHTNSNLVDCVLWRQIPNFFHRCMF